MYKVLIIDDETPSREAIRILGEWERLGVGEIREAADGRTGLALARDWRPDLAIVDMKMPHMNGIEFLRMAEEELPGMFTIVVSGFDDFEYTRQAIKSRVVDYLLKPVIRRELNQALDKAFDYLGSRKKQAEESVNRDIALNMSLPKLKETIFLSLIGRQLSEQTQASSLRLVGADAPGTRFCAAALRMMNAEEIQGSRFGGDGALMRFALTNVVNELGSGELNGFSFANPKDDREIVVLFLFRDSPEERFRQRGAAFLRDAVRKLSAMFGVAAWAGLGGVKEGVPGAADSYDEAHGRLLSLNLLSDGDPIGLEDRPRDRPAEVHSMTGRFGMIRNALSDPNPKFVRGIAEDFLEGIRRTGWLALGDALRLLDEIEIFMKDLAQELGVPREELEDTAEQRQGAHGVTRDFRTFGQYRELFLRMLDRYGDKVRQHTRVDGAFEIRLIKEYIDQRYAEDIKISLFTEKFFLSREYLMKLFKQEYGYGIYEYVLKVRMEKAKELLLAPELKIQNVSDMLGYKDKNYFSKAFKTYFGLSPSEFRQQAADNPAGAADGGSGR